MSDKERKEIDEAIKRATIGGRLSFDELMSQTEALVDARAKAEGTPGPALGGRKKTLVEMYARATREVLGIIPKEEWEGKANYQPTNDLVAVRKPEHYDPDKKLVDQYLFFDSKTAKKITKENLKLDELASNIHVFTYRAAKEGDPGFEIGDFEKPRIEAAMQKFVDAAKGKTLDMYAIREVVNSLTILDKYGVGESDAKLGDEIKSLNKIVKGKTQLVNR